MAAVPGVELQQFVECHDAVVRMDDLSGELVCGGEFEHDSHSVMDVVDDGEGVFDRERGVRELGPGILIVGLDCGFIFCEAETKTDEGIHMGIGDVVDELAYGPAAFAIRGVNLAFAQGIQGRADVARQVSDFSDRGLAFGFLSEGGEGKIPNRVARV